MKMLGNLFNSIRKLLEKRIAKITMKFYEMKLAEGRISKIKGLEGKSHPQR